ncbi:MAG: ATP-dependent carboxylate-amine ligase [Gammaproteobacteria bacterium]|nr:MAG: ATP-dependent carboxylate-amine ligase [Gammaproteobacteria bacterium]
MIYNILVLDAGQRSALAVTRSLGKLENIRVTTADYTSQALAGCSRFSQQYLVSPNPINDPKDYLSWIENLTSETEFALVLPVTEVTSQLLLMNSAQLPKMRLAFTSYENVMQIADKGNLVNLAMQLGISVPKSEWFKNSGDLNPNNIRYPAVIKPCLSKIYTENGWIATTVKIIQNEADLTRVLNSEGYLKTSPFMIQEFIPGHGAGIFCLFRDGKPEVFFAHQRLREKPPQGGISVLSESATPRPVLQEAAEKLLSGANWHGVAMVEFRIGEDGTSYLMEVNTRFWGSLQLSIDAGVDFPALLVSNELNLGLVAPSTYKVGQRLRWLLGDLDSLYIYLKSNYGKKQKLVRFLQFFIPDFFNTRHEVNRISDLKPAIFEAKHYLQQFLR